MKPLFNVSVSSLTTLHDMPHTWDADDCRQLLLQLEMEDVEELAASDLLEMTLMALQDLEPDEAADAVLECKLQKSISVGARQNIVQDFLGDQNPWEEGADVMLHSKIFASAVLLQKAFPKIFAKPDLMELVLEVTALHADAGALLSKTPEPAFVARILGDGLSERSILERLYDKQLHSQCFPEAPGIIWHAEFSHVTSAVPPSATLTVYSSVPWLQAMEAVSEFQSSAYNDTKTEESEPH
ncbi:MAG: hypothetical protein P1V97_21770 [Planctomycetota bacterium]|nr:hypothetical protein [Planctomycetota bacterium]